ncbi:unnamed protein product [Rotaria sp. Silwood1]|nr:unnamed protein product [Rotaria sp. Silwood1]
MSNSNVTKGMSGVDVNSEGKPYHKHADRVEKKKHEPVEYSEAKDHTPHHGHDNQICLFLLNINETNL